MRAMIGVLPNSGFLKTYSLGLRQLWRTAGANISLRFSAAAPSSW
jgi:hypothetical protein